MKFIKVLANPGTSKARVKYINLELITDMNLESTVNCSGDPVYYIFFGADNYIYVGKDDMLRILRAIDEYVAK